jgi:hypothetical protein
LGYFSQVRLFISKFTEASIYFAPMQNDIKRQILGAFLIALRPLARILLQFGIGFREFSEIMKTAFVDVASKDFGLRGRPTNISRVAVMTGLTRKEVRRLREKLDSGDHDVVVKSTPMADILHRWHSESDFVDQSNRPMKLPFTGEVGSFTSLVKKFGGDIPPGAMRTELKRVGAVREDDDGMLEVLNRTVSPKGAHEKLVTALVHGIYPLNATIAHNLQAGGDDTWAQTSSYSQSIRRSDVPRLRRISSDRLSEVAESIDDLFMAYEALHEKDDSENGKTTVVVGVYYFEEKDEAMAERW